MSSVCIATSLLFEQIKRWWRWSKTVWFNNSLRTRTQLLSLCIHSIRYRLIIRFGTKVSQCLCVWLCSLYCNLTSRLLIGYTSRPIGRVPHVSRYYENDAIWQQNGWRIIIRPMHSEFRLCLEKWRVELTITLPTLNRFSRFFHSWKEDEISNEMCIKCFCETVHIARWKDDESWFNLKRVYKPRAKNEKNTT